MIAIFKHLNGFHTEDEAGLFAVPSEGKARTNGWYAVKQIWAKN